MKLKADVIKERNSIVGSFQIPIRHIPLVASDMADHRLHLEKVYKGMLREACVIDDCCWQFEKIFREDRWMLRLN